MKDYIATRVVGINDTSSVQTWRQEKFLFINYKVRDIVLYHYIVMAYTETEIFKKGDIVSNEYQDKFIVIKSEDNFIEMLTVTPLEECENFSLLRRIANAYIEK